MDDNVLELKSLAETLGSDIRPQLANDIRCGFTTQQLYNFIQADHYGYDLDEARKVVKGLLEAENDNKRSDIFLEIFDLIYKGIETLTCENDLFFLVEFVGTLALLKCRLPDPPVLLLRALLNSIPKQYCTWKWMGNVAAKVLAISTDIGDLTYLCRLFSSLGSSWKMLTELLCWLTLKCAMNGDSVRSRPSIPRMQKLISQKGPPKTVRAFAMSIRLIGMLIHRLALNEFGKDAQESSEWIKKWMTTMKRYDQIFPGINQFDVVTLEANILDITIGWPVIREICE